MRLGIGAITLGVTTLLSAQPVLQDMHEARRQNQNVAWAGTKSAIKNNWMQIVAMGTQRPFTTMVGLGLIQAIPSLTTASYGYFQMRNNTLRTAVVPFSTNFAHSDATYKSQLRGLQSIHGSRSFVGGEAAVFNQRYNRR